MAVRNSPRFNSSKAFSTASTPELREISAQDMLDAARRNGHIDYSVKELNRKLTAAEVDHLKHALESLKINDEIENVTEFDISGQELGDHEVAALVQAVTHKDLQYLNLESNNLTVEFRKTLRSLAEKKITDIRYISLTGNLLGTGTPQKVRSLAIRLQNLCSNNPSLSIDAINNSFSDDFISELHNIRDEDGVRRICAERELSEPYRSTKQPSVQSTADQQPHGSSKPFRPTPNPFVALFCRQSGTSRAEDALCDLWRQLLKAALGGVAVTRTGQTFSCGHLPAEMEVRTSLIELLQGETESPVDGEELTLVFETNEGQARLTRTMANSPTIAATFIQAACIID
ncbi:hypothetical protein [Rhizobacter sp. Root16D2]|uniref:hypothetical protein n=1 Tax=Rhizobacter sp. Root16D2 TaxID=1736479 RepID=UPI000ABAD948|nr:hypothetical protein [Rhizobacter sp. Root16D2]